MTALSATKPHYEILDGLRGMAALAVVWYHICEGYAFAGGDAVISGLNHGYLAVDFFFILSGFVLGYAYDDRWAKGFTAKDFFKRRLIRLHPMVIMGSIVGVIAFLIQGCTQWDGTHSSISAVMLALLCAMFMIPATPGCAYEVRGNGEMFPLNGPTWSLFFEYIGNILYCTLIRRLSNKALAILTAILGICLGIFAIGNFSGYGSIGVGWTMDSTNFFGGLLRMGFPFTAGLLISRYFRPIKVRGAFWICSAVLLGIFAVPYISSESLSLNGLCFNGIFEAICIILVFPALLWIAASDSQILKPASKGVSLLSTVPDYETPADRNSRASRFYKSLGDLSYPLYLIHYPVMYLFYSWMIRTGRHTFTSTWLQSLVIYALSVALAILCVKFYDTPIRRRLHKIFDN